MRCLLCLRCLPCVRSLLCLLGFFSLPALLPPATAHGAASPEPPLPAGTANREPGPSDTADTMLQEPAPSDTSDTTPQDPAAELANPFAGFETIRLSNGVKVWFKRLPGVPNVSVSAGIPVGSDADPPGKEQLAHFTEHMLFSDHEGRTEQEIKDAVEGIGGRRNGFTFADHTWYYVTIGREHGLFAIEWLAGIMSPHEMDPAVVERGREPVENEIGAREREILDHLGALLNPTWLGPPGFWEREFGIEPLRPPGTYMWRSLNSITPDDLRGFYERYYAPGNMTVTIVGDLDRDEALAVAERTFGSFPAREVNRLEITTEDPGRGTAEYRWGILAGVQYLSTHKLFEPTADDLLTSLFVRDLLNRRLGQRLRYGERKAVYGASVNLVQRGPAAYLRLFTRIDEEDYDFATGVIDEEIEWLRAGAHDPAEFEADRAAVIERLRAANQTSAALNNWTQSYFFDPAVFEDFPDVVSYYENLTQEEVASFASEVFDESRLILSVLRPLPFDQVVPVLAVGALIWGTILMMGRWLTTPVQMKEIRYIARLRLPEVLVGAYTLGLVACLGAVAIASELGMRWMTPWIRSIDSYPVQTAATGLMVFAVLSLALLIYAAAPRKLLLFSDHVRIKGRAWRSRILHAEDIDEISIRRFPSVWLHPRILRSPPLTFGLLKPGIWLKPRKGRSYFFRVRDTDELAEVLGAWWGSPVE